MIRQFKTTITFCTVLLISCSLSAQQFHYKSPLATVDTTGFYMINISPELSAYLKTDFADIRIAGVKGQWIPHIIKTDWESKKDSSAVQLTIFQNTITDSSENYLVVENASGTIINNVGLYLKNAAVNHTAFLSGSNNQRYNPLLILNTTTNQFDAESSMLNYIDNLLASFTQLDSNKQTYLKAAQAKKYHVDKILLKIKEPAFYHREGKINAVNSAGKNQKFNTNSSYHFFLNAGIMSDINIPKTNAASFLIVIDNRDNPPLDIASIRTQQKQVALISYLEKNNIYDLLFGDDDATFPTYDLQSFQDSIRYLQPLATGEITAISASVNPVPPGKKNKWLWPVIILALVVLSFLSFKLVSEINKKNK